MATAAHPTDYSSAMSSNALSALITKKKAGTRCEDVQRILDSNPAAAGQPDQLGTYPLLWGMIEKAPADVIKVLVDACPEAAGKPDKTGKSPFHWGILNKAPANVIKLLVDACPEAAGKPDKKGNYLLHYGMANKVAADVIKVLVDASPEAAGKPDKNGLYPLHFGMIQQAPADLIKVVVDASPEAAGKADKWGKCPLHHGMKKKAPSDAIKVVVDACLEAAGRPDVCGMYPLHHGMENNAPADVIKVVFDACPEAAGKPDEEGKYPLRYGVENNAPADVIKVFTLVTQTLSGDALRVRNWLPWVEAARSSNPHYSRTVDMTQAVAEENGLFAQELEPVTLDMYSLQLSSPVLFKPLAAVPLTVVGMAVHASDGGGGISSSGTTDGEHVLMVNLAVEDATVGYVLRKVEALLDVHANLQPALYADRLWKLQEVGPAAATQQVQLKHGNGDQKLVWERSCGLRYVRKRTWRGLLMCAPKFDAQGLQSSVAGVEQTRSRSDGGVVGGGSSGRRSMDEFSSEV